MHIHDVLSLLLLDHPAATKIYTLSLHDALPIYFKDARRQLVNEVAIMRNEDHGAGKLLQRIQQHKFTGTVVFVSHDRDRKSTRLNSSHSQISYAVFCLKKKKITSQFK